MSSHPLVYRSAVASLGVQLVIALVTSAGFFLPNDKAADLFPIFLLELISQLIEMAWYTVVVCRYRAILTWTRYLDWVVSTPLMLVSTALFFYHRRQLLLSDVLYQDMLYVCLGLNAGMLGFGFAVERAWIPARLGLGLGGACFVGSFTALATFVPADDGVSQGLFWTMYAVWAGYGVAAAMPEVPKNVAYNALDIVSKNVYGVFLFAYALT